MNIWYDHATGKEGNLIDFGTQYFKYSIAELLHRLSGQSIRSFSFHPHQQTGHSHNIQTSPAGEKKENPESKIVIVDSRVLANKSLLAVSGFTEDLGFSLPSNSTSAVNFCIYEQNIWLSPVQINAKPPQVKKMV